MDATYSNHSAAAVVSAFSANQPFVATSGLPSALAYSQSNPHAQGNQAGHGSASGTGSSADLSAAVILASYVRHLAFVMLFFAVFLVSIIFRSISYFGTLTFAPLMAHTIAICGAGAYCFLIFGVSRRNYELWRDYFDGVCCADANRSSRSNSSSSSSSVSSSASYGGGNYGDGASSRLIIADPASPMLSGARGGAASASGLPGSPSGTRVSCVVNDGDTPNIVIFSYFFAKQEYQN
jgi:hypothetical protein